jgi:hypothetical protein
MQGKQKIIILIESYPVFIIEDFLIKGGMKFENK